MMIIDPLISFLRMRVIKKIRFIMNILIIKTVKKNYLGDNWCKQHQHFHK